METIDVLDFFGDYAICWLLWHCIAALFLTQSRPEYRWY